MKWVLYLVFIAIAAFGWSFFMKKGQELKDVQAEIFKVEEAGDPNETLAGLSDKEKSLEADRTLLGIFLTFVTAGIVGTIAVLHVLPFLAQRATHAVYDSAEMVEHDVMHDARSLTAQGDYYGAIEAFKKAAEAEPMNRLPWVEISKIQKDNLEDPNAAIDTIRGALEDQEWEINDAAFFLFRLAELYDEVLQDRASSRAIMNQVVDQFEGTRHSANAKHKLHEWDVQEEESQRLAEEAAFLARQGGDVQQEAGAQEEDPEEQRRREEEEYIAKMHAQHEGGEEPPADQA